jgi:hypothetical protein
MSMAARPELVDQLQKLGVETVTAEYNGEGDSGQIETPDFGSVEVSDAMVTAVEYLFYDVLEQHVKEDCGGLIPTVADWFRNIKREVWMSRGYDVRS